MFLAKAKGAEDGEGEALVLVKSLQTRDEQLQLDFRREAEMFGKLNHANVVRLLGLCREAEPHYMVLEYVDLVRALPAGRQGGDSSGCGACKRDNRLAAQGSQGVRRQTELTAVPGLWRSLKGNGRLLEGTLSSTSSSFLFYVLDSAI